MRLKNAEMRKGLSTCKSLSSCKSKIYIFVPWVLYLWHFFCFHKYNTKLTHKSFIPGVKILFFQATEWKTDTHFFYNCCSKVGAKHIYTSVKMQFDIVLIFNKSWALAKAKFVAVDLELFTYRLYFSSQVQQKKVTHWQILKCRFTNPVLQSQILFPSNTNQTSQLRWDIWWKTICTSVSGEKGGA